ncbi:MAG: pantetheine-phosphate adenylyltransferase, partial [Syntrophorhabdus sp.]
MRKRLAVYPGSFDPITNGHLDILTRGLELFDTVIVAIAHNIEKKALFTIEEKKDMIMRSVKDHLRVKVDSFEGLLVDYVKRVDAKTVIRGLRAMSDFEYEFQ